MYAAIETISEKFKHEDIGPGAPNQKLHESAIWALAVFQLLGIGCSKYECKALSTLREAGRRGYWKAWTTVKRLHDALSIDIPRTERVMIALMTMKACTVGELTERIFRTGFTSPEYVIKKRHGIFATREFLLEFGPGKLENTKITDQTGQETELHTIDIGNANRIIHGAVIYGLVDVAEHLVEDKHVNINSTNNDGDTPLNLACQYGHTQMVDFFLDQGADASIASKMGENGLYWLSSLPRDQVRRIAKRLHTKGSSLQHVSLEEDFFAPLIVSDQFLHSGYICGSPDCTCYWKS